MSEETKVENLALEPQQGLSQAQIKSQAIEHLAALKEEGVTEEHARAIFDRYDSGKDGHWSQQDLRTFLFDLQDAFDQPKIVPDETVMDVLKEVHLADSDDTVTWIAFKSYLIYLQQQPLLRLHQIVQSHIPAGPDHFVHMTALPSGATSELVEALFEKQGELLAVFVASQQNEAIAIYETAESARNALSLDQSQVLNATVSVSPFTASTFPSQIAVRNPSAIPKIIAKLYVSAQTFDDKHKISSTVKDGADKVTQKLDQFAEEHKIKEKLKQASSKASDTARQVDERLKISETTKSVDEKYRISERAAELSKAVKENATVQAGMNFITSLADSVSQKWNNFSEETDLAIAQQKLKVGSVANPNFEMDAVDDAQQQAPPSQAPQESKESEQAQ